MDVIELAIPIAVAYGVNRIDDRNRKKIEELRLDLRNRNAYANSVDSSGLSLLGVYSAPDGSLRAVDHSANYGYIATYSDVLIDKAFIGCEHSHINGRYTVKNCMITSDTANIRTNPIDGVLFKREQGDIIIRRKMRTTRTYMYIAKGGYICRVAYPNIPINDNCYIVPIKSYNYISSGISAYVPVCDANITPQLDFMIPVYKGKPVKYVLNDTMTVRDNMYWPFLVNGVFGNGHSGKIPYQSNKVNSVYVSQHGGMVRLEHLLKSGSTVYNGFVVPIYGGIREHIISRVSVDRAGIDNLFFLHSTNQYMREYDYAWFADGSSYGSIQETAYIQKELEYIPEAYKQKHYIDSIIPLHPYQGWSVVPNGRVNSEQYTIYRCLDIEYYTNNWYYPDMNVTSKFIKPIVYMKRNMKDAKIVKSSLNSVTCTTVDDVNGMSHEMLIAKPEYGKSLIDGHTAVDTSTNVSYEHGTHYIANGYR